MNSLDALQDEVVTAARSAGWVTPDVAAEHAGRHLGEVMLLAVDGLIPCLCVGSFYPDDDPERVPHVTYLVRLADVEAAPRRVRLTSV